MNFLQNLSLEGLLALLVFIGIVILYLFRARSGQSSAGKLSKDKLLQLEDKRNGNKKVNDYMVTEIFDYKGTKILHDKGKYIVNHKGRVSTYESWQSLPRQFQLMVKELDKRSQQNKAQKKDDYFMEIINGSYYITTPKGKKKRYDRFNDIPNHVRELLRR